MTLCEMMFAIGDADVARWNDADIEKSLSCPRSAVKNSMKAFDSITRVLFDRGQLNKHVRRFEGKAFGWHINYAFDWKDGISPRWLSFIDRYCGAAQVAPNTVQHRRTTLIFTGRWLAANFPKVETPGEWTRDIAAAYVSYVTKDARVGDFLGTTRPVNVAASSYGEPLSPHTRRGRILNLRQVFTDCIEWEWIKPRFQPSRAFQPPRALKDLVREDPRDLDDDIWAKLVAAAIALNEESLTDSESRKYPMEMVRAIALAWVFVASRRDEIRRLELDCLRWTQQTIDLVAGDVKLPTCELKIPVNKTGPEFWKPVDGIVGEAYRSLDCQAPDEPTRPARQKDRLYDAVSLPVSRQHYWRKLYKQNAHPQAMRARRCSFIGRKREDYEPPC